MESSVGLDDLPLELLYLILIELPAHQVVNMCQLSRYLNSFNRDWTFWREKAFRDFNYPPTIFDQTIVESPIKRYTQIKMYYRGAARQAVISAINHDNVKDLNYVLTGVIGPIYYPSIIHHYPQAISRGHLPVIEYLLDSIINSCHNFRHDSAKQELFDDCLITAAEKGHLHVIEYLIQRGATKFYLPFQVAAQHQQWSIVSYLLKHPQFKMGAAIDTLNHAAKNQQWTTVRFLLKHGLDIDRVIESAATTGNQDLIQYLADHRPKINLNPGLYVAAKRGDRDLVKVFLKHGADDIKGALDAVTNLPWGNHGDKQYDMAQYLKSRLKSSRR